MQRAAVCIDVAPIGRRMGHLDGSPQRLEELRRNRARGSVCAIDDNAAIIQRDSRHGTKQELHILTPELFVRRWQIGLLFSDLDVCGEHALDLTLDIELHLIRQLVTVTAEDLDAVVLPWIVRGGDDDARAEAVLLCEECDGRRCNHACKFGLGAAFAQAAHKCRRDPWSALSRVHAEHDAHRLAAAGKLTRQRHTHRMNRLRIERCFTCDRANPICSKQLSHPTLRA
jgi:hypothetical protein